MELFTLLPGVVLAPFPSFDGRPLPFGNEVCDSATPFGLSLLICACTLSWFFFDLKRNAIAAPRGEAPIFYANAPQEIVMQRKASDIREMMFEMKVSVGFFWMSGCV
jgi:hypothetical protein